MSELSLKYYFDVTRYNVLFSILVIILTGRLSIAVVSFGTFGMAVALLLYGHYQNIEYYFYLNGGLLKKNIVLKAFAINFIISVIFSIILWSIR